jgi:DNA (cytosine-5)-methyltransferase 1
VPFFIPKAQMLNPQFILPIAHELVIDLFAGGGGASTGIEQAIGRHVDIAVNHDPEAVSLHQANHPQTKHFVSDVFEVDPVAVTDGQPVALLWASPDCKHFSKAKGGKPVSKKIRGLAWVVVKWAKLARPRVIHLENVEEFQTWGPLLPGGRVCPERKGRTFRTWKRSLERLGYRIEHRELRACDYGAPTIRKRLFLTARCDGLPIVWPDATHAAPDSLPVRTKKLKPWLTAASCIDWSLPCPSIFERERPLADATMRRIAHGIKRYVMEAAHPFIVPVTHQGDSRVHGTTDPLRTITTAQRGEFALAVPTLIQTGYGERPGQAPRVPGLEKPLGTAVDGQKHALVAAFLAKHFGGEPQPGKTATSLDQPAPTVLASGGPQALVAAHVTKFRTGSVGSDLGEPLHTVTAGGQQARPGTGNAMGLVTAHLAKLRGTSNSANMAEPLATISAQGEHHGLVTSHLLTNTTGHAGGATDAPLHTVATGGHHAEVRALLIKYYGTDQDPQMQEPLHTVTTKDRFGLVTVKGEDYLIADIGMRMLQPRELYRAQGFPDSYIIDRGADGRALSKSAQVRMCGNSVCPPLARAIVAANFCEMAAVREAA